MTESFLFSLNAILPIVLLVLFGYVLRRMDFVSDDFVAKLNKFNFRYGFMALLFINVYSIETFSKEYTDIALYAFCALCVLLLFGILVAVFFVKDHRQKGVVAQACYRSNFAIIGIPLASALFGQSGVACAAVMVAVSIPLYNVSAVIILSVFLKDKDRIGSSASVRMKKMIKNILTNPMIIGVACGLVCLVLRPHLGGWTLKNGSLSFLYNSVRTLSGIATPLALICLGAQFKFSAVQRLFPLIAFSLVVRLLLAPAIALFVASRLFPYFEGSHYAALLALFGTPAAVASAIMAQQMGDDGELAGQIVLWSTLFSALTLFAFIVFFRSIGIF